MGHVYISAAHKSSGKTLIATGLARAFANLNLCVQPFKKGPDYIDPKWLGAAAGRACFNLDFNTQSEDEIETLFAQASLGADLSLIEGNKGLHDGLDVEGSDSNAALAKLLKSPVVLVISTTGITRGIAPLLQGYQVFDPDVNIAGIILNKVQGPRHESKLIRAVEHYTDIPVLGAVRRHKDFSVDERHLGLIPHNEHPTAHSHIEKVAKIVADQVDLDRIKAIADTAPSFASAATAPKANPRADVRIAVAKDAAFGFYYEDDLQALRKAGAQIVYFNALHDVYLPTCDALFLGGGFPETQMEDLNANKTLRRRLKAAIEAGLPVYAECGGLMYLSQSITWQGKTCDMVGVIKAEAHMNATPQGRGYTQLVPTASHPWPGFQLAQNAPIAAHEFHYASLENIDPSLTYAYDVKRGHGVDGRRDGIVVHNVVANFTHLRDTRTCPWAQAFTAFVRTLKSERGKAPSPAQVAG